MFVSRALPLKQYQIHQREELWSQVSNDLGVTLGGSTGQQLVE